MKCNFGKMVFYAFRTDFHSFDTNVKLLRHFLSKALTVLAYLCRFAADSLHSLILLPHLYLIYAITTLIHGGRDDHAICGVRCDGTAACHQDHTA